MTEKKIPPLVILIVDDDDFLIKELTALILHDRNLSIDPEVREKIRILYAKNGAEALALLQQKQKVNLILLDIVMPIMDGYEICKILRRNPEFAHCVNIPIFFISGAVKDSGEQLRGIELEADEVFSKPFDPMLLGSYIKKELKRQIITCQNELVLKSQRLIGRIQERAQKQNIFHFVSSHTYSHSARVEVLSTLIGSSPVLGLSEKELISLKEMVRDHDKGKIGIPEEILNKPRLLSEREVSIIQMHTAISSFLINAETFEPFSPAVYGELFHHEKYLGGGYPTGRPLFHEDLFSEETSAAPLRLHLLLSIVNCADALDALTSKRPYKEAVSLLSASRILVENCYSHFDPIVIEALFERLAGMDETALKKIDQSATKKTIDYYLLFMQVFAGLRRGGFIKKITARFGKDFVPSSFTRTLTAIREQIFNKVLKPFVDMKVAEEINNGGNEDLSRALSSLFRESWQPLEGLSGFCPFLYAAAYCEIGCSYRFLSFSDIETLKEDVLKLLPAIKRIDAASERLSRMYNACLVLFFLQTLYYIEYLDLNNVEHADYLLGEYNGLYELWKRLKRDAQCLLPADHFFLRKLMRELYEKMIAEFLDEKGDEKRVSIAVSKEKIDRFVSEIESSWNRQRGG